MSVILSGIELVVFDLDDTLYLERDFAVGGFAAVADVLARRYGGDASKLRDEMISLQQDGRRDVFQVVLTKLAKRCEPQIVDDLVELYRTADRVIDMCDDADRAVEQLRGLGLKLAVLTDGPVGSQRTKVRLIGLADRVECVVYTAEHGEGFAKPGRAGFELLERQFGLSGARCLYIGDNERKDFAGPNGLGWETVKVVREGALYSDYLADDQAYRPRHVVETLDQLQIVRGM